MLCSGWVIVSTPSYEFLNDTLYDKRQSVGIWVRLVRSFQGSWGWDMRGGGSEGDKFFREDSLWILWGLKDSLWTIILDSNHYKLTFLRWEDHWICAKWSVFLGITEWLFAGCVFSENITGHVNICSWCMVHRGSLLPGETKWLVKCTSNHQYIKQLFRFLVRDP